MVLPHRVVVYIRHFICREPSKNSIKVINDDKDNITLSRALCWEQVRRLHQAVDAQFLEALTNGSAWNAEEHEKPRYIRNC